MSDLPESLNSEAALCLCSEDTSCRSDDIDAKCECAEDTSEASEVQCPCTEESVPSQYLPAVDCRCPRGELDLVEHETSCLLYKNEKFIKPHDVVKCECRTPPLDVCNCCACPDNMCLCKKAGREAFDVWRKNRKISGALPAVMEVSHPLMLKFQDTLTRFLEKENALAQDKIVQLRDDLKGIIETNDKTLEDIYRMDKDTNGQRTLILEYESAIKKVTQERMQEEYTAQEHNEKFKVAQEKFDRDTIAEKDAVIELETLTKLCKQLEVWREETKSDIMISHCMNDKMKKEHLYLAQEKRELDIVIFNLSTEVWKFQTKLEMYQAQYDLKNTEMDEMNDKLSLYTVELDDLELDKRRLVSMWNAVLVNVRQRNRVYESVKNDYNNLRVNYRTLVSNLEITKKAVAHELNEGKSTAMVKDKLEFDLQHINKQYNLEQDKSLMLESNINEIKEAIAMSARDQELINMENQRLLKFSSHVVKEVEKKSETKIKLENEILKNFEGLLLNSKSVESLIRGINKMRDISRKQEIMLASLDTQHSKIMLDIEIYRSRHAENKKILDDTMCRVEAMERELTNMEQQYEKNTHVIIRQQRNLDILKKRFQKLSESKDGKSPDEVRFDAMEQQINEVRKRTEQLQQEWLRLQGHVVRLTQSHQRLVTDINLINTQIQICEQRELRIRLDKKKILAERSQVEHSLQELKVKWDLMQGGRKEALERNDKQTQETVNLKQEFGAKLKDAESQLLEIEEEIERYESKKKEFTRDLDQVQREALIWQRKGILAVELKNNIKNAQSAGGDIGKMKIDIARMELIKARREHLRHVAESLSSELAQCITRRESALEKNRANAAVAEKHKDKGITGKVQYHHKLRLAKADIVRVTKDIDETTASIERLESEEERLKQEIIDTEKQNTELEEKIVNILEECYVNEREKQWLLQRIIRNQHLGNDLAKVVKRQSLRTRNKVMLQDFVKGNALNDRLHYILHALYTDYPYLKDKLAIIQNTLNIHSPTNSPRLIEDNVEVVVEYAKRNMYLKHEDDD